MKKLFVVLFAITLSMGAYSQLPDKFKIEECVVSIGTDFEISEIDAQIEEKVLSIGSNFTLTIKGIKQATAKQQLISIGSKINIYDGNDNRLGHVQEQIFTSLFGVYSKYNIFDRNNNKVAYSEKHDLMTTSFYIKDLSGSVICTIKRPMINLLSDSWSVEYKSNIKVDKRLLVFIPCYKTHRDNSSD